MYIAIIVALVIFLFFGPKKLLEIIKSLEEGLINLKASVVSQPIVEQKSQEWKVDREVGQTKTNGALPESTHLIAKWMGRH